jgi:hypothetical protein
MPPLKPPPERCSSLERDRSMAVNREWFLGPITQEAVHCGRDYKILPSHYLLVRQLNSPGVKKDEKREDLAIHELRLLICSAGDAVNMKKFSFHLGVWICDFSQGGCDDGIASRCLTTMRNE